MLVVVITFSSAFTIVMALALCLCWKRKDQKNELLGLEGMVTQKNPDENVNHLPSAASQCFVDGKPLNSGDSTDVNKRSTIINNPRRSLPDIPLEGQEALQGDIVTWEPNGDNSSDLYASVDQYQNQVKRPVIHNGVEARPSISQHSSISQSDDAFSPYARVNYEQLLKQEHPYARLQNQHRQSGEDNSADPGSSVGLLRHENLSTIDASEEPNVPPRSRRSSAQSAGPIDIPAATAVAGGIAANQELPYMTPPIVQQTNFSGDSQDSSKGYTSISVREPLANIIAQTKEMNRMKRDLDPHYATVSDDSDDVYTTIPDANNPVYTSGSETYARIPPLSVTVEAEINPIPPSLRTSNGSTLDQLYEPAPQPPSVDSLRQVAHSHSRQASSSSSIGNLSSPKPEKRQANSPLPPPPSVSPDSGGLLNSPKNLDDMYAKVHKTKKKEDTEQASKDNISRLSSCSTSSVDSKKQVHEPIKPLGNSEIDGRPLHREHNYETLRKLAKECTDPGYEKIKASGDDCGSEPGYASINGPSSILSSDPGYEVLKANSDVDPNYEQLRHRTSGASDCGGYSRINPKNSNTVTDGYSVVNKHSSNGKSGTSSSYDSDMKDLSLDEPNYESMPSESGFEHSYAAIKSTGSESDPNYESVNHSDPNYESVKYLEAAIDDPPYERLQDNSDSNISNSAKVQNGDDLAGYETIQNSLETSVKPKCEPAYERLSNEFCAAKNDNEACYEKVQKADKEFANSSNKCDNDNDDSDEDAIIQV